MFKSLQYYFLPIRLSFWVNHRSSMTPNNYQTRSKLLIWLWGLSIFLTWNSERYKYVQIYIWYDMIWYDVVAVDVLNGGWGFNWLIPGQFINGLTASFFLFVFCSFGNGWPLAFNTLFPLVNIQTQQSPFSLYCIFHLQTPFSLLIFPYAFRFTILINSINLTI